MPLVFVHGVGNRPGDRYSNALKLRDGLFRRFLLPHISSEPAKSQIESPLWGTDAACLRWDHASLPIQSLEMFGGADLDPVEQQLLLTEGEKDPIVAVARRDLKDAVDLLYSLIDIRYRRTDEIEGLIDFAVSAVSYCDSSKVKADRAWADEVGDDHSLVTALTKACSGSAPATHETFGAPAGGGELVARGMFSEAIDRLRQKLIAAPTGFVANAGRRFTAQGFARFLGDVADYLSNRGTADRFGPIVENIVSALDRSATSPEPLVVVAHSMGGNIMYDILSHFRPDLKVDVLVTVGSQVGLFEELKLFRSSDKGIPARRGDRVPRLTNIGKWINIIDLGDILAYRAAPVFEGVDDYNYPSLHAWAHTAYFRQPNFHARLGDRIREVLE